MPEWPFKGDSPVARARKMALAYRAALEQYNRDLVKGMDDRFVRWGERWHTPQPVAYSDDDWIPTDDAAALIQITPGTLSRLRVSGRINGKLRKHVDGGRGFAFRVADVYKLSSELRPRGLQPRTSTDKVSDSGSSVSDGDP